MFKKYLKSVKKLKKERFEMCEQLRALTTMKSKTTHTADEMKAEALRIVKIFIFSIIEEGGKLKGLEIDLIFFHMFKMENKKMKRGEAGRYIWELARLLTSLNIEKLF